jgi:hypothetical protein
MVLHGSSDVRPAGDYPDIDIPKLRGFGEIGRADKRLLTVDNHAFRIGAGNRTAEGVGCISIPWTARFATIPAVRGAGFGPLSLPLKRPLPARQGNGEPGSTRGAVVVTPMAAMRRIPGVPGIAVELNGHTFRA